MVIGNLDTDRSVWELVSWTEDNARDLRDARLRAAFFFFFLVFGTWVVEQEGI